MVSPIDRPIWERFIESKLTQTSATAASEHGSIALHASADTANLMREIAVKSTSELFSAQAAKELAARGRFVDFVRAVLSCAALTNSSKKAEVATRCVEVPHVAQKIVLYFTELQGLLFLSRNLDVLNSVA